MAKGKTHYLAGVKYQCPSCAHLYKLDQDQANPCPECGRDTGPPENDRAPFYSVVYVRQVIEGVRDAMRKPHVDPFPDAPTGGPWQPSPRLMIRSAFWMGAGVGVAGTTIVFLVARLAGVW